MEEYTRAELPETIHRWQTVEISTMQEWIDMVRKEIRDGFRMPISIPEGIGKTGVSVAASMQVRIPRFVIHDSGDGGGPKCKCGLHSVDPRRTHGHSRWCDLYDGS